MSMRTHGVEPSPLTGRQIAFEMASGITAGVGIMIKVIRQLYAASRFTRIRRTVRWWSRPDTDTRSGPA